MDVHPTVTEAVPCMLEYHLGFLFGEDLIHKTRCLAMKSASSGVLCTSTEVWSWGLYTESKPEPVKLDIKLEEDEELTWVGCCSTVNGPSFLLTSKGAIYGWGGNSAGWDLQVQPTKIVVFDDNVRQVCVGDSHIVVLTQLGEVFSWGYGGFGSTGHGVTLNSALPTRVLNLDNEKVVFIEACNNSSAAITEDGQLFTWGANHHGQLGLEHTTYHVVEPTRTAVSRTNKIVQFAFGDCHALALDSNGDVFAWGRNDCGQLGLGHTVNVIKPTKINGLEQITSIAAFKNLSVARKHGRDCFLFGHRLSSWPVLSPQRVHGPLHQILIRNYGYLSKSFAIVAGPEAVFRHRFEANFNRKEFSDIAFEVDGQLIYLHRAILQIANETFRTAFLAGVSDRPCALEGFSYEVWLAFFRYLYTAQVNVSVETALSLVQCMNRYMEACGQAECEVIIRRGTTVENAARIFGVASQHNLPELAQFVRSFILKYLNQVIPTEAFGQLIIEYPQTVWTLLKDSVAKEV